jgi:hypothetical protein
VFSGHASIEALPAQLKERVVEVRRGVGAVHSRRRRDFAALRRRLCERTAPASGRIAQGREQLATES